MLDLADFVWRDDDEIKYDSEYGAWGDDRREKQSARTSGTASGCSTRISYSRAAQQSSRISAGAGSGSAPDTIERLSLTLASKAKRSNGSRETPNTLDAHFDSSRSSQHDVTSGNEEGNVHLSGEEAAACPRMSRMEAMASALANLRAGRASGSHYRDEQQEVLAPREQLQRRRTRKKVGMVRAAPRYMEWYSNPRKNAAYSANAAAPAASPAVSLARSRPRSTIELAAALPASAARLTPLNYSPSAPNLKAIHIPRCVTATNVGFERALACPPPPQANAEETSLANAHSGMLPPLQADLRRQEILMTHCSLDDLARWKLNRAIVESEQQKREP